MATSGPNFHNRFVNSTSNDTIAENASNEAKDFGIDFKDFSDFSPTLDVKGSNFVDNEEVNEAESASLPDEKEKPDTTPITSLAESYTTSAEPALNHVAALEADVEEKGVGIGSKSAAAANTLQREAPSSNSISTVQTASTSNSTSSFQQAVNDFGSRNTLPRPPMIGTNGSASTTGPSAVHPALAAASPYQVDELSSAVNAMDMNGRGGRTPEPGVYAQTPRRQQQKDDGETRSRPSSFFGLDKPLPGAEEFEIDHPAFPGQAGEQAPSILNGLDGAESIATRGRRSSFFGMEQPMGHVPNPDRPSEVPSQAARIAASHRNAELAAVNTDYNSLLAPKSSADSGNGIGDRGLFSTSTRPASIAPTLSGPLLDHSHLKPGLQASLLSHNKTLELYRQNAKKTNDPNLIYEFAVFMVDASKSMGGDGSSGGSGAGSGTDYNQGKEEHAREELAREATGLLKKIAERGHMDAQYFLADCYANGIGSPKGKQDFDRAYPLFVLAAKHGHPDAAYRAGTCYEKGWGCRKDLAKALQFYRKAASQTHPGAMYRLATAELNGDLGLKKSAREGVKWLKRSAESATPEFPHALHELALLHERGIDNVLFVDEEYACELLAQAAEMGYAPSAYKLGVNYEYGRMGCPQDGGLSIHMYNIAAQQNHKEACFALTAWYLVGAPGILPQSDTEAYLWAKKAAEQGLAKAEYAVGYFTEMGIGTVRDLAESRAWYRAAAEHGDKRANQRLTALGGQPVTMAKDVTGSGTAADKSQPDLPPQAHPARPQQVQRPASGIGHNNATSGQVNRPPGRLSAQEQGQRAAAEHAQRMMAQAEQNRLQNQQQFPHLQTFNPPNVDRFSMPPNGIAGSIHSTNNIARPMPIRDHQVSSSHRDPSFQMAIQQQHQHRSRGSPAQSSAASYRQSLGPGFGHNQHHKPSSAPSSHYAPSVYSSRQGSGPPSIAQQSHRERPPPGRQGSMPVYPPGKADYPSYPSHMSAADSYNNPTAPPPRHDSPSPIPQAGEKEKKKSLWTQITQI